MSRLLPLRGLSADGAGRVRVRALAAFGIRGYPWLWGGIFGWSSGQMALMVAQGWLILGLADEAGALWLGAAAAVKGVGRLGFGPFGGLLADRFDRRKLLMAVQSLQGAASLVVGVLVVLDRVELWHIMVFAVGDGVIMSVAMPTRNALTFDLAGRQSAFAAISANGLASGLTGLVSPVVGGVLTATVGAQGAFFFVGASGLGASAAIAMVPARAAGRGTTERVWSSLREGVVHASGTPRLRAVLLMDMAICALAYSHMLMMPVFAKQVLGLDATGLGLLMSAAGLGRLVAGATLASLPRLAVSHRLYGGACLFYASAVASFAFAPWLALALPMLVAIGVGSALFDSISSTLVQMLAPEELRGRIAGLQSVTWGTMWPGGLLSGAIASVIGAPLGVGAMALAALAVAVGFYSRAPRYSSQEGEAPGSGSEIVAVDQPSRPRPRTP